MGRRVRWLSHEEMRAWTAFLAASALIDRQLDQQLKNQAGLTHVQYEILARLSGAPDRELRMTELADSLYTSQSGITYQITQLEKLGLVRRRPGPSAPRAVYATLTDAGWDLLKQMAPDHVATVRRLLIDVLTPAELTALADGLGRARDRILDQDDT